ncbi:MAG: trehalose-phosphatase [Alphaproteobacteria bacterium]|nr:trehalose-phosphatase [Alphaproteobacteria bacterium]
MKPYLPDLLHALLEKPQDSVFLLDFDGTMVDFATNPDDVHVPDELIEDIRKLAAKKDLAFAIVTGRPLSKLDYFMKGVTTVAIGSHGAEWRPVAAAPSEKLADPMPEEIRKAITAVGERHQCIVEDKFFTLSLHLPFDDAEKDLMPELIAAAGTDDYSIRRTGRTYEVLQKSVTKGTGIRHLMEQPGFAGRQPVYIGDDVHIDAELNVVEEMRGLMFGVAHTSPHAAPNPRAVMSVRDVCRMIALLAEG